MPIKIKKDIFMRINEIDKIFINETSQTSSNTCAKSDEKFFDAKFNDMEGLEVEQNVQTNTPEKSSDDKNKIIVEKSSDGLSETKYKGDEPLEYIEKRKDGSTKWTIKQLENGNFQSTLYRKDGSIYSQGEYLDFYEVCKLNEKRYDQDGVLVQKSYNNGSNLVHERYKNGILRVQEITDPMGESRVFERTIYNKDGSIYIHLKYDINGNVVENIKNVFKDKPGFDNFNKKNLDGDIDDGFEQGMSGSCYFVSTVQSFLNTEKGRDILRKSISYDSENQTATIKFLGVNKEYQFKDEEIKKAMGRLSTGDPDFAALLLGYEQYRTENLGKSIDGGFGNEVMKALYGEEGESNVLFGSMVIPIDKATVDDMQNKLQKGNFAITVHTPPVSVDTEFSKKDNEMGLINTHAYSLKSIDDDNVYVINPSDQKIIKLSREKFIQTFTTFSEVELK